MSFLCKRVVVILLRRTLRNRIFQYSNQRIFSPSFQLLPFRRTFINVYDTPNPNSLKFVPNEQLYDSPNTLYITKKDGAKNCNLAIILFEIRGIESIMIAKEFISVNKSDDGTWSILKPQIFAAIQDFINCGEKISIVNDEELDANDSEIVKKIKELLISKIRPIVQEDGGDIIFHSFDETSGIVKLKLQGSCSNCPSSSGTLKNGAKNMLKFFIPEVIDVEEYQDESELESDKIFRQLEKRLKKIKKIDDVNDANDTKSL